MSACSIYLLGGHSLADDPCNDPALCVCVTHSIKRNLFVLISITHFRFIEQLKSSPAEEHVVLLQKTKAFFVVLVHIKQYPCKTNRYQQIHLLFILLSLFF